VRKIDLDTYKRKGLFEAFKDREIPYFAVTSHVDITGFKEFIDRNEYGFFVPFSYFISRAVNLVPELRHRISDGELYEFDTVDPSYTVLLDDDTFSFCNSKYMENFAEYREYAAARIKEVKERPDCSVGAKNHMFFISNLPWFSFTSIVHPFFKLYATIPLVSIGKYFRRDGRLLVPIGMQAHHAVADGFHAGRFYSLLSDMCRDPEAWIA